MLCIIPIIKKRHLENNIELFGMIPNINYKNNNLYEIECDFSDTNLCYSKNDINSKCIYPKTYYECSDCKENSEVKKVKEDCVNLIKECRELKDKDVKTSPVKRAWQMVIRLFAPLC